MFNLGSKHWNMIYDQGKNLELPSSKLILNHEKSMEYIKTQIELTK